MQNEVGLRAAFRNILQAGLIEYLDYLIGDGFVFTYAASTFNAPATERRMAEAAHGGDI